MISHQTIAIRAHQLWEEDGCRPNQNLKYWIQAERELLAEEEFDRELQKSKTGIAGHQKPSEMPDASHAGA